MYAYVALYVIKTSPHTGYDIKIYIYICTFMRYINTIQYIHAYVLFIIYIPQLFVCSVKWVYRCSAAASPTRRPPLRYIYIYIYI